MLRRECRPYGLFLDGWGLVEKGVARVGASLTPDPAVIPSRLFSGREGEPFELRCSASTTSPLHTHLALQWEVRRGPARRSILSLTHEGRFRPGPGYEQRYRGGDVRLDTVGSDGYRLSVSRALSSDQGSYRCIVSEWIGEQGNWQEIQEKAVDVATVVIQPTGELLRIACFRLFVVVVNHSVVSDSLQPHGL